MQVGVVAAPPRELSALRPDACRRPALSLRRPARPARPRMHARSPSSPVPNGRLPLAHDRPTAGPSSASLSPAGARGHHPPRPTISTSSLGRRVKGLGGNAMTSPLSLLGAWPRKLCVPRYSPFCCLCFRIEGSTVCSQAGSRCKLQRGRGGLVQPRARSDGLSRLPSSPSSGLALDAVRRRPFARPPSLYTKIGPLTRSLPCASRTCRSARANPWPSLRRSSACSSSSTSPRRPSARRPTPTPTTPAQQPTAAATRTTPTGT